jgi:hypothetical protein
MTDSGKYLKMAETGYREPGDVEVVPAYARTLRGQFDLLEKHLSSLHEQVDGIIDLLSPLMGPEKPEPQTFGQERNEDGYSHMVFKAMVHVESVYTACLRLESIRGRIEV